MTQIIDKIHQLQEQFNQVTTEHRIEHDKYNECCQHKDLMGQQISLDRKKELGLLRIRIQHEIADLTSTLTRESSI